MSSTSDIEFQRELEKINEFQKEYEDSNLKNLCVECGIDMGYMNPRQYCGKTFCYNKVKESLNEENRN